MKRKATTQLAAKKPTTSLAKNQRGAPPPKPQLRGAKPQPTKNTLPTRRIPVQEPEESEDDEDDYDESSGEDIGDINEYLKGEDEQVETKDVVFDFDDGEVSINPNKKKYAFSPFYLLI